MATLPRPAWLRPAKLRILTRRVHMYLGLLLLPWLLFFGVSGILFNHPNLTETATGQRLHAPEIPRWDPAQSAIEVTEQLNAQGASWSAPQSEYAPRWEGYAIYSAKIPGGQETVIWDVGGARGVWVQRQARAEPDDAHLEVQSVELTQLQAASLLPELTQALDVQGRAQTTPLRAHPRIAPRLRWVAVDDTGQAWNLEYHSSDGTVHGRRSDATPALGISQLFGMMHTTHHFPMNIGARWFWALFEDLLGLAMVVWACSGLLMWWQLKRTRRWGLFSIILALAIALSVMVGTAKEITFGDITQKLGPGS